MEVNIPVEVNQTLYRVNKKVVMRAIISLIYRE